MEPMETPTRSLWGRIAGFFSASRREDEFVCGDCERWEQCGLKPDKQCIARAAQLEANGGRPRRRSRLAITW